MAASGVGIGWCRRREEMRAEHARRIGNVVLLRRFSSVPLAFTNEDAVDVRTAPPVLPPLEPLAFVLQHSGGVFRTSAASHPVTPLPGVLDEETSSFEPTSTRRRSTSCRFEVTTMAVLASVPFPLVEEVAACVDQLPSCGVQPGKAAFEKVAFGAARGAARAAGRKTLYSLAARTAVLEEACVHALSPLVQLSDPLEPSGAEAAHVVQASIRPPQASLSVVLALIELASVLDGALEKVPHTFAVRSVHVPLTGVRQLAIAELEAGSVAHIVPPFAGEPELPGSVEASRAAAIAFFPLAVVHHLLALKFRAGAVRQRAVPLADVGFRPVGTKEGALALAVPPLPLSLVHHSALKGFCAHLHGLVFFFLFGPQAEHVIGQLALIHE